MEQDQRDVKHGKIAFVILLGMMYLIILFYITPVSADQTTTPACPVTADSLVDANGEE